MGEIVRSHPRWFCRLVVRNGADGKRAVKYQTCWPRATATKSGLDEKRLGRKTPWTKNALDEKRALESSNNGAGCYNRAMESGGY
jgi:hypothetical protein